MSHFFQRPVTRDQHRVSSIEHRASSIEHPVSSIQYPAASHQKPETSNQRTDDREQKTEEPLSSSSSSSIQYRFTSTRGRRRGRVRTREDQIRPSTLRPATITKYPLPNSMNITCHKCLHYYVTWDQHFPHGCRIMGFKSRPMPMFEVRRTMHGKDCLFFEVKKMKNPQPNFQNRK